MTRRIALLLPLALAGCDWDLTGLSDRCDDYRDSFTRTLDARYADAMYLTSDAGHVRIEGRAGTDVVRIRATACAADRYLLDDIRLVAREDRGEIRVAAEVPGFRGRDARLDLVIELPEDFEVEVVSNDGDVEIRRVRAALVDDGDDDIEIDDVRGEVVITDGSGDIDVRRVDGDLWLLDDSGHIEAREVGGSVLVDEDGSGDMDFRDVRRDVWVREDGSGDIDVADVGGDFVVDRDGSGRIRYANVRGRVSIP